MAFRLLLVVCLAPGVLGGGAMWDKMMEMLNKEKKDDNSDSGWGGSSSMGGWGGGNSMGGWGGGNSMGGWGGGNSMNGWGGMNMKWMMEMKKMMEQMKKKKEDEEDEDGNWMKEHSKENIDSYMKWCAEKKERQMMMSSKKQFVKWIMEEEEKTKMAMAKAKMEMQTKERQQKIKMQYDQWKLMFSQQQNFENLLHKFKYMKSEYKSTMMCELLKFCKCTDVNTKLKKYFYYTGANSTIVMPDEGDTMFDIDDIRNDLGGDLTDVARKVMGMDQEEKMRLFFGTAIHSLCEGAKEFAEQVRRWEVRYGMW